MAGQRYWPFVREGNKWADSIYRCRLTSTDRISHCGDQTLLRPSCLYDGISYTGKTTSLNWIRAQIPLQIASNAENISLSWRSHVVQLVQATVVDVCGWFVSNWTELAFCLSVQRVHSECGGLLSNICKRSTCLPLIGVHLGALDQSVKQ